MTSDLRDKIPVYLNPRSGSATKARPAVLRDARFTLHELSPSLLADELRGEMQRGTSRVAVCGGDGTIATALGAAAGTTLEVAVIPGGTLNHFARDLGLPLHDFPAALEIAATGVAKPADLGYINGHTMLNTSSVGTYTDFVRFREAYERWCGYRLASVLAAVRVWVDPHRVSVDFLLDDGTRRRFDTPLAFVGVQERNFHRGGWGYRVPNGERALHFLVVDEKNRARLFQFAFGTIRRGLDELIEENEVRTRLVPHAVAVVSPGGAMVAVDGELVPMTSPLRYEIKKDAVIVVHPPTTSSGA